MPAMTDTTDLAELDKLLAAIRGYDDPRRAGREWKQVYKLLVKTDLPPGRVTGVVGMRDVPGLVEMLERLRTPGAAPAEEEIDPETLRKALHAFRKRLRLTVLDEESKLGRGPLSKGAVDRDVRAICPPVEWPAAVWQTLVQQGRLRYLGHGLYYLPDK